jgi:lipopolysaccharide export LptBFGC system permease protein LptF
MKHIRIWERSSQTPKLIIAQEGELNSFAEWTSLKLYNGIIHQADRKDPTKGYVVGSFGEDEVVLDISGSLEKEREVTSRARNMSIKEARESLRKFHKDIQSTSTSEDTKNYLREYAIPTYLVELYKKISIPFACLAFGLIGVPVGLIVRRGGRMVGLGVGVSIITLYYVFLTAGERVAKAGLYPPFLGAWMPNMITAVVGIILIIRTIRETPIRSARIINRLFPPREDQYGVNPEVRR